MDIKRLSMARQGGFIAEKSKKRKKRQRDKDFSKVKKVSHIQIDTIIET